MLKSERMTKLGCFFLFLLFILILEVLASVRRKGKEIEGTQVRKREIKVSLLSDDIIAYIENLGKIVKKVLRNEKSVHHGLMLI